MPENNQCPITLEDMRIPTITNEGHSYELSAIADHLLKNSNTDPLTRERITILIVNQNLKDVTITFTDKELIEVLKLCLKIRQKYPEITIHGVDRMTSVLPLKKNQQNIYAYFKNTPPKENSTYQKAVTKLLFAGLVTMASSATFAMIGSELLKSIGYTNYNTSDITHNATVGASWQLSLHWHIYRSRKVEDIDELAKIIAAEAFQLIPIVMRTLFSLLYVWLHVPKNENDAMKNTLLATVAGMLTAIPSTMLLVYLLESLNIIENKLSQRERSQYIGYNLEMTLEEDTDNIDSLPQMRR